MKRLILFLFALFTLIASQTIVNANNIIYPGGKNYLDINNFTVEDGGQGIANLVSINPIYIKPNKTYIFQIDRKLLDVESELYIYLYSSQGEDLGFEYLDCSMINHSVTFNNETVFYVLIDNTDGHISYVEVELDVLDHNYDSTYFSHWMLAEGTEVSTVEPFVEGAELVDISSPTFENVAMFTTNVDNPITVAAIKATLEAYDEHDGEITENIQVKQDNYTQYASTLGTYNVVFSVKDSSNNEATATVYVKVVDETAPVIVGDSTISVSYPNELTAAQIKEQYHSTDNYDGDISSTITVDLREYATHKKTIGTYVISISSVDSSNNNTTIYVNLKVIDEERPIISGPQTMDVCYNTRLSLNDNILNKYTVSDNYDTLLWTQIAVESNDYHNNWQTLGTYHINLAVYDSSNNKGTFVLTINVIDNVAPIIYIDSSYIEVSTNEELSLDQLSSLLFEKNELDRNKTYTATVLRENYSTFSKVPGVYYYEIRYKCGDEVLDKLFYIDVKDNVFETVYTENKGPNISKIATYALMSTALVVGSVALMLRKRK